MRFPIMRTVVSVIVVVAAAFGALSAWAVSSPPGSSPDDDYHLASIWCGTGESVDYCEAGDGAEVRELPADLLSAASCFAYDPNKAANCPRPEGVGATTRGNWNGESYPPLYYAAMRLFVSGDLSLAVVTMRLVNVVFYLGVVTSLFFLLPRRARAPLIWGAMITAVPLSVFLIASLNPSAWAIISATGLWLATWGYFSQRGGRKIALAALTVLLLVVGAGARSDAAVYGVIALVAGAVLAFRRDARYARDLILPVALTAVAVAFFFSGGQSAVVVGGTVTQNQTHSLTELLFINLKALPELIFGFVGFGSWGLGWLDTYMPGIVSITGLIVFGGVIFWGLSRSDARKWVALAGVALSTVAVPLYTLMHDGVVVGNGVQPRYGLPLVIMFAGIAVFGFARASLGLGRAQLIIAALGVTVANSIALHVNLRRYVTGLDRTGINLNRDIEWWWNAPVSPMAVWIAGSVAFAVMTAMLVWRAWPTIDTSMLHETAEPRAERRIP